MTTTRAGLLGVLAVSIVITGCPKAPRQSPMMAQADKVTASVAELRVRVYDFAERFGTVVVKNANEIMARSDDPEIRLAALRWKIEAVPAAQTAAFKFDPLAGLLDIWGLSIQMQDYFETGDGRDLFGEWQSIAIDASEQLREEVVALATEVASDSDISEIKKTIEGWALNNPVDGTLYVRRSIRPLLADITGQRGRGAVAAVGSLSEGISDISERMVIHAETLPHQIRWQAELILAEMDAPSRLDAIMKNTDAIAHSLDRATVVVEQIPDLVESEAENILTALRSEIEGIDEMVDTQRAAAFDDITAERIAVLEAVERERAIVIDEIRKERVAIVEDAERIVNDVVDRSFDRVEAMVDGILWRVTILLAVGFVGLFVTVIVAARIARR